MIIGVDFDNTIVSYDDLFYKTALELRLIPPEYGITKNAVRNYFRKTGKEEKWTELQGIVYGTKMREAKPFPGVIDFFIKLKEKNIPVFIISHKTEYSKKGTRYNLHDAALNWLEFYGFFNANPIGLDRKNVSFNGTRAEKINKIIECKCSHFIDDLPELFEEKDFPANVERLLFDPRGEHTGNDSFKQMISWNKIMDYLGLAPI